MATSISAAFVLRTLERLKAIADHVGAEELAGFLTAKGVPRGTPWFLGTYLDDVRQYMPADPEPVCAACGEEMDEARADRRYCSARCRQRAHRSRVTDNRARDRQSATNNRIGDASAGPKAA